MKKYSVKNMSKNYRNYKYTVVRDCNNESKPEWQGFWYWGSYDDLELAQEACRESGNGFIVESENIVPLTFREW